MKGNWLTVLTIIWIIVLCINIYLLLKKPKPEINIYIHDKAQVEQQYEEG